MHHGAEPVRIFTMQEQAAEDWQRARRLWMLGNFIFVVFVNELFLFILGILWFSHGYKILSATIQL